jgi:hypothetical protein
MLGKQEARNIIAGARQAGVLTLSKMNARQRMSQEPHHPGGAKLFLYLFVPLKLEVDFFHFAAVRANSRHLRISKLYVSQGRS